MPDRERYRILEVSSADLDDVLPLDRLGFKRAQQGSHFRKQCFLNLFAAAMCMAVGNVPFEFGTCLHDRSGAQALRSKRTTCYLNGAVGTDLLHIHVALGTTAGLPYVQGKVLVQLAENYLLRASHDQIGFVLRQTTQALVHDGRWPLPFYVSLSVIHLDGHVVIPKGKVNQRTLRLCTRRRFPGTFTFPIESKSILHLPSSRIVRGL